MLSGYNNGLPTIPTGIYNNINNNNNNNNSAGSTVDCRPITSENSKQFTVSSLLRLKHKRTHNDQPRCEGNDTN